MNELPLWQLHDARARFGELFRRARTEGPQRVVSDDGKGLDLKRKRDKTRKIR